jgi:KDO2-lipid IV(A) lauroyltransferase
VRKALNLLGIIFARIAYLAGVRRRVTRENIKHAYPELTFFEQKKIARKAYSNLGIVFAEMVYLRFAKRENIARHICIVNPELFLESLNEGKGLIVVAGHFANWEWLALGGALHLGKNFAIVRKNIQTSFTERFLEKMRIRTGNSLVNSGDIRRMYYVLQSGNCIALLADQAAPGESIRVPFFGREVPTFEGPSRLALRNRAPMLFAECIRDENENYRITFHLVPYHDLTGDSSANIKELTYRHTHLLEEIIRKHPSQWLWLHRRWKYV